MLKAVFAVLAITYTVEWIAAPPADSVGRMTASLMLLPRSSIMLIEIATLGLLIVALPRSLGERRLRILLSAAACVSVVAVVWAFGQGLGLTNVVLGLRQYLRPLPLALAGFLVAVHDQQGLALRRFLSFMTLVAFAQVPVSLYQAIALSPRAVQGQTPQDVVSGTFGPIDGGTLAMFLLGASALLLTGALARGRVGPRAWMMAGLLVLPSLLAGVRAIFVIVACVVLMSVLFLPTGVRLGHRLIGLAVMTVIFVSALVSYDRLVERGFLERLGPALVQRHLAVTSDGQRLTRGAALVFSARVIASSPSTVAFGMGVGSATRNFVGGAPAPYYFFETDRSTLSRLMIEGGIVGLALLAFLVLRVSRAGAEVWKAEGRDIQRGVGLGFIVVSWVALLTLPYADVLLRPQFGYPFWFLGAYLLCQARVSQVPNHLRAPALVA